jgi:SNF2 family DNA or RNA helicase
MSRLKAEGIPYSHITGDVSQERRNLAVQRYNEGLIKVLIISKAGGEGLDLKNTTSIVLMEPSWNEATHRQVIGRAVRFQSHTSLPRAKQHVLVYRLHMIKPSERPIVKKAFSKLWLENEDGLNSALSIDLYLRNRSILKQIELDEFMATLRRNSIEQRVCP